MFKGLPFARALQQKGHRVEVLTGSPNYPSGFLYPGYKLRLIQKEKISDIPVIRTFLYPSHNSNKILRALNYLSFSFSAALIGSFLIEKPNVIYAYHPPATIMLPACLIKIVYNAPIVLDIQDMWTDTLLSTYTVKNKLLLKTLDYTCRLFYVLANRIVVLSPGFKRLLVSLGVSEDKIDIVYNWCDEENVFNNDLKKIQLPWSKDKFTIVYVGNLGRAQGLSSVLKAAKIIEEKDKEIQFVFIGNGVEADDLVQLSKNLNLDNVLFMPQKNPSEIGPFLRAADALLVHLKNDPLSSITIPSKTQTYIAVGRPIIMAVKGDAAEIVKKSRSGHMLRARKT
jgi:glycosyltransferase involved in cell wall biosynthesis